ncbi:MAG: metal-dependent hydrolase [Candidatus Hodarchaeales archaeon]|jgi:hypothetical protein
MMPHVHLLVGITGANILAFWGYSYSYLMWFILGSLFPDIDFIFNLLVKKNNHREYPTHFSVLYFLGAFLYLLWAFFLGNGSFFLFWFLIGALFHIFVDYADFGIYLLAPLSKKSFSFLNLDHQKMLKKRSIASFLQCYYQNRKIIALEIIVLLIWIFSLFL